VYAWYSGRAEIFLPDYLSTAPPTLMPKLISFRHKALLADLFHTPMRLDTRHRDGINVLFGEGSAHWVARADFNDQLVQCPTISANWNPYQLAIWQLLDGEY
jgi:hypothetical protein